MRIAFSGTACVGKSTLVQAFLRRWPTYKTPEKTYRDVIKENNLDHSSQTSEETQLLILDWMMKEQEKYPKDSKVIYDRCPWDNLAYTLLANSKDQISDEVTAASISFVKESMKNLDLIFYLKYDPSIKIINDSLRDTNVEFIKETDSIFQQLFDQYSDALENDLFYPKEDCPAIIVMEGKTVDDRLAWIGEFIDYKGDLIETTDSVLSEENLGILEQLLKDQEGQIQKDGELKKMIDNITSYKL